MRHVPHLHRRRRRRGLAWGAAAIVALAAVGCNSSDSDNGGAKDRPRGGDQAAVRKVLVTAFKSRDSEVRCSRVFTRRLFRQLFTGKEACRMVLAARQHKSKPPKRVEVSGIDVSGQRARGVVRLVGGDTAGAEGGISLAKEDGAWRVDDLSLAYLRSALTAGLAHNGDFPGSVGPCFDKRLRQLPDGPFKDVAYGSIGGRPDAERALLPLLTACENAAGRTSTIRRKLNREIAKPLRRNGAKPQLIACVTAKVKQTLSDKALIELAGKDPDVQRAKLRQLVTAALTGCGGLTGGGNIS